MPIKSDKGLLGGTVTYEWLHANDINIALPMDNDTEPSLDVLLTWYAQAESGGKKDWPSDKCIGSQAEVPYSIGNISAEATKALSEGDMRTVAAVLKAHAYVEEAICCLTMRKKGTDFVGNLTSTLLAELPAKLAALGLD